MRPCVVSWLLLGGRGVRRSLELGAGGGFVLVEGQLCTGAVVQLAAAGASRVSARAVSLEFRRRGAAAMAAVHLLGVCVIACSGWCFLEPVPRHTAGSSCTGRVAAGWLRVSGVPCWGGPCAYAGPCRLRFPWRPVGCHTIAPLLRHPK